MLTRLLTLVVLLNSNFLYATEKFALSQSGTLPLNSVEGVDLSRQSAFRANRVLELLNTPNESYGPNCWNTALLVSGLTDSIYGSSNAEYWHWMNSPFCKVLSENEPLRYGDLGSVFSSDGNHFHSFMRIDDSRIFQKAGPKRGQKWEITNFENVVFREFQNEVRDRCKGNELRQSENGCDIRVVYHRCQPVPSNFYSKFDDLKEIELSAKTAELEIKPWMRSHDPRHRAAYERATIKLGSQMARLKEMRFSGEKEFARKSLALRLAGIMMLESQVPAPNPKVRQLIIDSAKYVEDISPKEKMLHEIDRSRWRTFDVAW